MPLPRKKPHVCLDARLIDATGIGTFIRSVIPELEERFQLTLLKRTTKIYSLQEQLELARSIPACDLFWSPHFNIPLLPIKAKKRLVTIHDVYHLAHPRDFSWYERLYASWLYKSACRRSTYVTTSSEFSRKELLKYCPLDPQKLKVILIGVRAHFRPTCDTTLRDKYGLPETYFLAIGNMKPHKNISRLVKAYEALNLNIPLVLAGGKVPSTHPKILSIGYVEEKDLPALYSHATATLYPSLYEGYGLPAIEAMACGSPLLCSRVASLPEVCGEAAEYVDPTDVESIKRGLRHISNEKRQKELRALGLAQAKTQPAAACGRAHADLIEELVA